MARTEVEKAKFRLAVKVELTKRQMTQRDLTRAVAADLGIKASYPYINSCIAGTHESAPVRESIKRILKI